MYRRTLAVTGAALVAATTATTAIAAVAGASPAPVRRYIQHFDTQATAQLETGKTSFVLAEQDVAGAKTIGHDVLFCHLNRTDSTCHVAFAQTGGLLYAGFVLRDSDHTLRGSVTGGSGRYRHAHGTITGHVVSQSDVRIALRYQV